MASAPEPAADPTFLSEYLKKFYRKDMGCINPRKKVLKSKRVIFKVSKKTSSDKKRNPKAAK
jgi:hypothetical protein